MKNRSLGRRRRRATTMIIALAALLLVSLAGGQLLRSLAQSQRQSRQYHRSLQAMWLAESGLARAAARLQRDGGYPGETWRPTISGDEAVSEQSSFGRVEIVVLQDEADPSRRQIRVTATFPDDPTHRALCTRQQDILVTSSGVTP